ncbi:MAG: dTMP kinase [Oscillospiraceae bacterium]
MGDCGKLLVLEGLDGSGKSTQFERLKSYLSQFNMSYKAISFPDYEQPSSALVKMYLKGEFSENAEDVNAYAASSFYAVDRYASYKKFWENDYKSGSFILAARYVTSNCIYQMVKLDKSQWSEYINWLEDYEYKRHGLPRPDMVLFLDMPIEISQKLMTGRYEGDETRKDIHEANIRYLYACREAALYTAKKQGWKIITCSKDGKPLSVDEISDKIKTETDKLIKKG